MALDGTASLDSVGAPSNIATWQWVLVEKPPGSTASLLNPTTATPTLTNIDIIGNYVVFLLIVDNLGASSFDTPYPRQHLPPEDFTTFEVPLYAYESPVAGAFVVVKAPYNNTALRLNQPLYKTGRKEYGWLEDAWNQTDTIEDLREEMLELYDRPNLAVNADQVNPQTGGAGVSVDGLNIKDTGSITALDSNRATIRSLDHFSVAANKNLTIEVGTGALRTDTMQSTSGGNITSLSGLVVPEVITPRITAPAGLVLDVTGGMAFDVAGGIAFTVTGSRADYGTGNFLLSFDNNVTIQSNNAILALAGDAEVRIDTPGAFNAYAQGGAFISGGAGAVTLDTTDNIFLQTSLWTESAKPVFAPGLKQGDTATFSTPAPGGSPITLASFTTTKQAQGVEITSNATFYYLMAGVSNLCQLSIVLSSTSIGTLPIPLETLGGAKALGQISAKVTVSLVSASAVHIAASIIERIGAGAATAAQGLAYQGAIDVTDPLTIELVLTPDPGNTWTAGSACNGMLSCHMLVGHAESVL
jgi:hypothetical protein